jgi:rhombotail lipoprotein
VSVRTFVGLLVVGVVLGGCVGFGGAYCGVNCGTHARNSSSLVGFLYPDGKAPPPENSIPELHLPLRVGLAFLPSQPTYGAEGPTAV